MAIIELKNLTKDYGDNHGIFNLNVDINKGEMVGFVGTNGSGKTTTIRNILGFVKPTSGHAYVKGMESWKNSSEIFKSVGYVPGEIAFPDLPTGTSFLKSQSGFLNVNNREFANKLIEKLQLDPSANLKRMSKGMKQKTALVAALLNDKADILILDEPTTGLDPLMRLAFLDIIKEEHKKGKTILMSSHMFDEIEKTCDKVVLINNGYVVDIVDMDKDIRNRNIRDFKIEFNKEKDYESFKNKGYKIVRDQKKYNQLTISVLNEDINKMLKDLKACDVKFISEIKYTLEMHFRKVLKNGGRKDV